MLRADRQRLLWVLHDPGCLLGLSAVQLDLALRQLRRLRLLAHVALALRSQGLSGGFSREVQEQLASSIVVADARARLALWELDRIAAALRPGGNFPLVVLKGCAYLMLHLPHAAGRVLTDVDLLVPEDRLQEVEGRLCAAGWESTPMWEYDEHYYREWAHEIPPLRHPEREIEVDVHHNLLMRTARFKPRPDLLLQDVLRIGDQGYCLLSPPDMVLHAMAHLFCSSEMDDALRELVDIDVLLRWFSDRDPGFWAALLVRARVHRLERPAWYALRYSMRWLETPVPDAARIALDAARPPLPVVWLMDRLVPEALFPRDPDQLDAGTSFARLLLLARLHWIRMPPLLLSMHLVRKTLRRLARKERGSQ